MSTYFDPILPPPLSYQYLLNENNGRPPPILVDDDYEDYYVLITDFINAYMRHRTYNTDYAEVDMAMDAVCVCVYVTVYLCKSLEELPNPRAVTKYRAMLNEFIHRQK